MQGTRNQKYDIVDHVAIGDEVKELWKRLHGLISHMLEFNNQLLPKLIIDHWHRQRRWLVGQKTAIIGTLQMKLQIYKKK